MLKSISLKNYKCFKDETKIDVTPLTVLCGVNSSGKSSILKSLLMLKQSYEGNYNKGQMLFAGNNVDNGTFKDIVFNGDRENFTISLSFEMVNKQQDKFDKEKYYADNSDIRNLDKMFEKMYVRHTHFAYEISVEIMVAGNVKAKTLFQALKNRIIDYNIIVSCYDGSINKENYIGQSQLCMELVDNIYQISLKDFPLIIGENKIEKITEVIEFCHCYFDGIKVIKIYSDKPSTMHDMNSILPNIYTLHDIVATQFYNIKHMTPLRQDPSRRYIITHGIKETNPEGDDFAQILAQHGSYSQEFTFIEENDGYECNFLKENTTLLKAAQKWAYYLNVGKLFVKQKDELLKVNINDHNLLDVGFGVSQSLPILVSGLHSPKDSTIIFEQPEIHLHPKAQMNMADFLLSLSLSGKNVIVETHSDHIINRIVRRILENKDETLLNMVKIYFVKQEIDKDKDIVSKVYPVKLDMVRGFYDVDEDFFSQFGSETMKIFNAGTSNM